MGLTIAGYSIPIPSLKRQLDKAKAREAKLRAAIIDTLEYLDDEALHKECPLCGGDGQQRHTEGTICAALRSALSEEE